MKNEDKMIDALLKEHARIGAEPDEPFIEDVENRLDEDGVGVGMLVDSADSVSGVRSHPSFTWGIGLAAALTIGVVGYFGWRQDHERDLAMNDTYMAEVPIVDAEAEVNGSTPVPVVTNKASAGSVVLEMRKEPTPPASGSKSTWAHFAGDTPADEGMYSLSAAKEDKGGSVAADSAAVPQPMVAAAPVLKKSKSVASKPKGRVVPGNSKRTRAAVPQNRSDRRMKESASDGIALNESALYEYRGLGFVSGGGGGGVDGDYSRMRGRDKSWSRHRPHPIHPIHPIKPEQGSSGNRYGKLVDNQFLSPWKAPLSTFSVDVDTASYTNIRSLIRSGRSVPADAVRIEEMINYFNYAYPQPDGAHPFSVKVESASCPWNPSHRLVKIGLQGKEIIREKRPSANLVFLLDVSGSMNNQDKLPLLIDSMKILLKELNGDDTVSIVVYAGAQGLALPPTHVDGDGRKTILKTLTDLHSGGSTDGGSGIKLAYQIAKKHFVKGGVNRVILGTDGDFNVGLTDNASLISMVEREAKTGVFLSVLGFGQGNLNDSMLEAITNKGNGNYAYIDNLREGRKVFLDDMMGTMVTIAKDVKIQVEFNPAKVKEYRLIGYANRMLKAEDFKKKRIDAGEIGAGHTVTALYEIVPGHAGEGPVVDGLKYQKNKAKPKPSQRELVESAEMMTVKLAYKQPEATKETESTYFNTVVMDSEKGWESASDDFKFSSSVALFGMLQRKSNDAGQGDYALVKKLAEEGRGKDPKGHRTEFSDLVRKVK